MRLSPLSFAALWLALGCSEGALFQGVPLKPVGARLTYLSPFSSQADVPLSASLYARLSQPLTPDALERSLKLYTEAGVEVPGTLSARDERSTLVFTPTRPLSAASKYEIRFRSDPNAEAALSGFTTTAGSPSSTNGFHVLSVQPCDVPGAPVYPFTTLHLLFSEPVRSETVVGGDLSVEEPTFRLVHVASQREVKGALIARGSKLSFDPDEDLKAGETYRLEVSREVTDLSGEALEPLTRELTVAPALLTKSLSLTLAPGAGPNPLDGRDGNSLQLRSALVGNQTLRLSGSLKTDMPDLGSVDTRVPLVIRKGQQMSLSVADPAGLALSLYGQVPTGLHSGPLTMLVLTDSVGEIIENPTPGAPPLVRMALDASLSAGDLSVHTLLNQDLLHLQLTGVLKVQGEALAVDLIGGAELELLGMETAPSFVTLSAVSAETSATPSPEPFAVRGSFPLAQSTGVPESQELRLVFSSAIDAAGVPGRVWLEQASGDPLALSTRVDGATLVVKPLAPLPQGTELSLHVAEGLPGVAGKALETPYALHFSTRSLSSAAPKPVMVAAIRPGVPCALVPGMGGPSCNAALAPVEASTLAANLPIEVAFTRAVDPATVRLGKSVRIEQEDGGTPPGRFEVRAAGFRFTPDAPWSVDKPYRLVLNALSGPCGPERICDLSGVALNTDVLLDSLEEAGGAPLEARFIASASAGENAMALNLAPFSDLNANGVLDPTEKEQPDNSVSMRGTDGGVVARSFLAGTMLTAMGQYDADLGGIPVTVAPGTWMFGTSTVMYGLVSDRLIIRPARKATGLLRAPDPNDVDRRPVVNVSFASYVEATNDTVQQALSRAPLQLELTGRLSFGQDGTLVMEVTNSNAAQLSLLQGNLVLGIAPGDVRIRAATLPLKP